MYTYRVPYHSVCPLLGIGMGLLTPYPESECVLPPPSTKGRGKHTRQRVRARGWGSPNSDDWRESLVLCLFCGMTTY
jgi:hypothetical protein